MQKLINLIFIFLILIMFTSCDPTIPDDIENAIKMNIGNHLMDVFDFETGKSVNGRIIAGKHYILAVNVQGMKYVKNTIKSSGWEDSLFADFRVDPSKGDYELVSVENVDNDLLFWHVYPFDLDTYDERGSIGIRMEYRRSGMDEDMFTARYFNIFDETTDRAVPMCPTNPKKKVKVNVGYLGSLQKNLFIGLLRTEFEDAFKIATKSYAELDVKYMGRKPYPANGEHIAGSYHNYIDWWNSVSHDLEGTSLEALDPNNPDDLEYIQMAWYEAHKTQLRQDLIALFDTANKEDPCFFFTEIPFWGCGGAVIAMNSVYNNTYFKQSNISGEQWGKPKGLALRSRRLITKTALHEFGHLIPIHHPENRLTPSGDGWKSKMFKSSSSDHCDLMSPGMAESRAYAIFYNDEDIKTILAPEYNLSLNDSNKMDLPKVYHQCSNTVKEGITLAGRAPAGSTIHINKYITVKTSDSGHWLKYVPITNGENRFSVVQRQGLKKSHPYLLFVDKVSNNVSPPLLKLRTTIPSSNSLQRGKMISITLEGKAREGLRSINWWVEKKQGLTYQKLSYYGFTKLLHKTCEASCSYLAGFDKPGQYKIKAIAKNALFLPASGTYGPDSDVKEISFVVY